MTHKAKESVKYSLATHAAEKMTPSRKAVRLCEKIAEGRITGDSAVEQIKRSYGIDRKRPNA
ncbi:MAG: antitoxin VbhA family protein [Clostridiales bacterium]|nr:antitoxin VbhA family protein [Clostridiales bacterium]